MPRIAYDFTPFPRKLHPGWAGRSHASLGLCLRLWMLADGQPIQVHGADWRASLCQQMGIGGRDRPTTRALMADLQTDGLMAVSGGFVTVIFHPGQSPEESSRSTTGVVEGLSRGSTGVQPGVGEESDPIDLSVQNRLGQILQTDRQTEETEERDAALELEDFEDEEEEPEPEPLRLFRTPLGEPPPDFADRDETEPTLQDRIISAWRRGVSDKGGGQPADTKLARLGAAEVAKWLHENVRENETPLSAFQAALKLYLAEDKPGLRKNSWPLAWLVERLPGYRAPAPKPEAPKSNNPTHQVWKAPDYEAEMRDSYDPERIRREQEKFWAEHPEFRPSVDEEPEPIAPPPTRVVVSIAEAKPQVKPGYRTKTPEEIAERKRLLEEQVRALKAANASE